jgi:hypothetical protein
MAAVLDQEEPFAGESMVSVVVGAEEGPPHVQPSSGGVSSHRLTSPAVILVFMWTPRRC